MSYVTVMGGRGVKTTIYMGFSRAKLGDSSDFIGQGSLGNPFGLGLVRAAARPIQTRA